MKTVNIRRIIVGMTIIALAGIAIVAAPILLVQSVNATDVMTGITAVGEEEAVSATNTTTKNYSNTVLGSLFLIAVDETTSFKPINETYTEISFVNKVTIVPPNAAATTTINATEIGNVTVNIQPRGVSLGQGQSLIVIDGDGVAEQENATTTFVDVSRTNPDGIGSGTQVVFFSTNSTGQLAFLDNMLAIAQIEFSPEGYTIRMWEWKGGKLPFENGSAAPITGNQTTITSELEEEG
jgi:hypothetical protein